MVGTGAADKAQVAFMIARLLPTAGSPTADAADAPGRRHRFHAHARLRQGYGGRSPWRQLGLSAEAPSGA